MSLCSSMSYLYQLKVRSMRIKIVLLTLFLITFSPVGFAQSNGSQQLRRYVPRMLMTQQDFGQDKLSVNSEKSIPLSTRQALIRYLAQHYRIAQLLVEIYKVQEANNLY